MDIKSLISLTRELRSDRFAVNGRNRSDNDLAKASTMTREDHEKLYREAARKQGRTSVDKLADWNWRETRDFCKKHGV